MKQLDEVEDAGKREKVPLVKGATPGDDVTAVQKKLKQWAAKQMSITYIHLSDEYKDCVFKNLQ